MTHRKPTHRNSHTLFDMTSHRVALASSSVYPQGVAATFRMAADCGFDGVEVMVSADVDSQSADSIAAAVSETGVAVIAIHAPCLFTSARVWGNNPTEKLARAVELAQSLGAETVVTHPAFLWQRDYATGLVDQIAELNRTHRTQVAVENMYPLRSKLGTVSTFAPTWDVQQQPFEHLVLDTSHTSVARQDVLELWNAVKDRVRHVHLSDATGKSVDEHLLPGLGRLPLEQLLAQIALHPATPDVVLEVNTSRLSESARLAALRQAVAFVKSGLRTKA